MGVAVEAHREITFARYPEIADDALAERLRSVTPLQLASFEKARTAEQGVVRVSLHLDGGDCGVRVCQGSVAVDVRGVRVLPDLERDALWVSALELDQPKWGGVHFPSDPVHRRKDALANRDLTAVPARDTIGQDRLAVGRAVAGHQANEERRRVDAAVVGQARLIATPLTGLLPQQTLGGRRDPPAVDVQGPVLVVALAALLFVALWAARGVHGTLQPGQRQDDVARHLWPQVKERLAGRHRVAAEDRVAEQSVAAAVEPVAVAA